MGVCPCFVDETGVLDISASKQPVYGIGLLVVHNPAGITDSLYKTHFNLGSRRRIERRRLIKELRSGQIKPTVEELDRLVWRTRHHEYKFSEVTAHNLQEYIDLLNVYFEFQSVEFHALVVDKTNPNFNLSIWGNDTWAAYVSFMKDLLQRRLQRKAFAIVDLQNKPDSAVDYVGEAICNISAVSGCLRATSDMSVYLQLTDLLLGCVQFDWNDQKGSYNPSSRRAEAKRHLTTFVKSKLRIPPDEPFVSLERNFRRRTKPSTFTVWLPRTLVPD
jgi:hypothetical protein